MSAPIDPASSRRTLVSAGVLIVMIAIVHLAAIVIGPSAFVYLDAAELAVMIEQGSSLPTVLTLAVTAVLGVFALYAFSGAGLVQRLPQLHAGLLVIGAIFTFRGLGVFWFGYLVLAGAPNAIPREIGFSLLSLVLGLLVLAGRRGLPPG